MFVRLVPSSEVPAAITVRVGGAEVLSLTLIHRELLTAKHAGDAVVSRNAGGVSG